MGTRRLKYNPGLLSDDEIRSLFAVRYEEMDLVLQRIRENMDARVSQHVLIVGPRGCGKTTLVRAIAAKVRATPDLAERWYPLALSEETYNVSSLGELWLEALFHLARQTGEARYQQAHEEIRRERDEQRLRVRALGQLVDFAEEQGKRLVLIIENLQMLFEDGLSDDEAWAFRDVLLHEPNLMLLATATTRFDQIENTNEAMYEQFLVTELQPLPNAQCRQLWKALTGEDLSSSRARPLQILTGGNVRLLTVIAQFAVHLSFRDLMQDLVCLVDDHTDYFKSHLDALPAQERKVFVTVADIWDPAGARQVAEHARMDVSQVSAHLSRLVKRGAVAARGGKSRRYQVAERLYNIYYLLRRQGDSSSRVRVLVQFMVSFYEPRSLEQHVERVLQEMAALSWQDGGDHRAFLGEVIPRLPDEAQGPLHDQLQSMLAESAAQYGILSGEGEEEASGIASDDVTRAVDVSKAAGRIILAQGRFHEAERAFRRATELQPGDAQAWSRLGEVLERDGRLSEAEEAFEKAVELQPDNAGAWNNLGVALGRQDRFSEAEQALAKAVELQPADAASWTRLGAARLGQNRVPEAENALRKAIDLAPDLVPACGMLALALRKWRDQAGLAALASKIVIPTSLSDDGLEQLSSLFITLAGAGAVREVLDRVRGSPLAYRLEPLVCALRMLNGEDVSAALEIMEVARDVVDEIERVRGELAEVDAGAGDGVA